MTRTATPNRRVLPVLAAAGLLALAGCGERSGMSSAPAKSPTRMSSAELSKYAATAGPTYAVNAIIPPPASNSAPAQRVQLITTNVGPAEVTVFTPPAIPQETEPPLAPAVPAAPSRPRNNFARNVDAKVSIDPKTQTNLSTGIKLIRIVGEPKVTREEAKVDAVRKAKLELVKRLEQLDPPVCATPSLARIQSDYIPANACQVGVADDPKWEELRHAYGKSELFIAEVSVELTDDQIRQLRQEERVQTGLIGVGGMAVGAFALFGLLRVGTAAGRFTRSRFICGKFLVLQILFWTIGPPLAIYLIRSR